MRHLIQEKKAGFFARQQIDVLADRLCHAPWLRTLDGAAVLEDNGGGDALDLFQIDLAVALGDELCRGITDAIDIHGEDTHRTGRDHHLRQLHAASLQLHVLLRRKMLQTLVIVDEDEATLSLRPHAPPQERVIALLDLLRTGERSLHRCQHLAPVLHKQVEFAQSVIMRVALTELAERCLEVVILHGHIVIVGGHRALHLVEPGLAIGIGAAVIHIVAQQVRATAEFDEGHRIGILGIEVGPTVVGGHHTATQFTGEVGIQILLPTVS